MGSLPRISAALLALALTAEAPLIYPVTPTVPIVDNPFGESVADPYRWLEGDIRADQKVRDWVTAENAVTRHYLDALPTRASFLARLKTLYDFERYGVPRAAGGRYFYTRNSGLQDQSPLYVRAALGGPERLLLDPNRWSADGTAALADWTVSDDGRRIAYSVQDAGSDWRTIRVLDVESGATLDDAVKWVKFSNTAWLGDGSGFFYSRYPAPEPGQAYTGLPTGHAVWLHRIGTPQSADVEVYATPRRPGWRHAARVTHDGRYLLIQTTEGTDPRIALSVARLGAGPIRMRPLIATLANNWSFAGSRGATFWFATDLDAPRQRIVSVDVEHPARPPVEIVPQGDAVIVGATLVGERLITAYLGDARSEAALWTLDGRWMGAVKLPGIGTAIGFSGREDSPETFFSFSGFATPPTIYRFDVAANRADLFAAPRVAFDPEAYDTQQVFYPSKDGTRIPMFVVRRKNPPPGPAPTLLYGYGGFNVAVTPGFSAARMAWLEQGGVLAVANLRGGGEYGRDWHDSGRLARKQNVFDDFIAAAEWLIAQGITAPEKLAIQGGSNGGLLVGAVINQRPDLFAAALPAVGVMDMLRFDRFTAGRTWIDDYGDPRIEADWRVLRAYSPYHNIVGGRDYPAILVTTADTDDRVVPAHSFKYAAALQAASIGSRPHLIRIEMRAGHGSGRPTAKLIDEAADQWAFLARWTGMIVK